MGRIEKIIINHILMSVPAPDKKPHVPKSKTAISMSKCRFRHLLLIHDTRFQYQTIPALLGLEELVAA